MKLSIVKHLSGGAIKTSGRNFMKVFLATTNTGKIERFKKLLGYVDVAIDVYTASDLRIAPIDVEEIGATLALNARLKAQAYVGKVDMPILANDTGFYVEGEGFVNAPKRIALGGVDEHSLTKEEISKRLLQFWKGIATKYGGRVDATWIECFVAVYPDGTVKEVESRREVLLTDEEFGIPPLQMPVRALYISKITNKPALFHSLDEERLEMEPVVVTLIDLLK